MKKTRKQKGGNILNGFPTLSFRLSMPSGYTKKDILDWSDYDKRLDNLRKSHLLELLEGEKVLCKIRFTPKEDGKELAYLNYIECKEKTAVFKRSSYLIMYKFLEILKYLGVQFVFFSVAAVDKFWKLYSLYHGMGYVCVHEDETKTTNNSEYINLKDLNSEFKERTDINEEYFLNRLKNVEKLTNDKLINLSFEMYRRCYFMFGSVEDVMNKIEKYVVAQKGGSKKRKTRKNGTF